VKLLRATVVATGGGAALMEPLGALPKRAQVCNPLAQGRRDSGGDRTVRSRTTRRQYATRQVTDQGLSHTLSSSRLPFISLSLTLFFFAPGCMDADEVHSDWPRFGGCVCVCVFTTNGKKWWGSKSWRLGRRGTHRPGVQRLSLPAVLLQHYTWRQASPNGLC
jgi:hypothetical protein